MAGLGKWKKHLLKKGCRSGILFWNVKNVHERTGIALLVSPMIGRDGFHG
jgi:hypothetical protein